MKLPVAGRDLALVALGLSLFGALYTPLGQHLDAPFRVVAYQGTRAFLSLVGEPHQAIVARFTFVHGQASTLVTPSCSGLRAVALWSAFVAFVPCSWQRRALHFFLGAALLLVVNVVRLAHLFHARVHDPASFPLYHEWIWPVGKVGIIVAYWTALMLVYLRSSGRRPPCEGASISPLTS